MFETYTYVSVDTSHCSKNVPGLLELTHITEWASPVSCIPVLPLAVPMLPWRSRQSNSNPGGWFSTTSPRIRHITRWTSPVSWIPLLPLWPVRLSKFDPGGSPRTRWTCLVSWIEKCCSVVACHARMFKFDPGGPPRTRWISSCACIPVLAWTFCSGNSRSTLPSFLFAMSLSPSTNCL